MSKTALPQPPKAPRVTWILIPQPRKVDVAAPKSSPSIFVEVVFATTAFKDARVIPHPLESIPATASLPELVREFRQIRIKLRSPRCPFEPQHLQDLRIGFKELMQRDSLPPSASRHFKKMRKHSLSYTRINKCQKSNMSHSSSFRT